MWRSSRMSETWGSDFDHFMKIYSLMPFDAFNGSLVEQCLIHVAGFKLVIHSRIQGKGKEKSPKRCQSVVTGLTGDRHRSDRCQRSKWIWVGGPTRVPGWLGTPLYAEGWPDFYGRVTRNWSKRLWETQHISINKSFMCCDQVLNEPHQVLNRTKCLAREIRNL
jgi:hypothetical protein